VKRTVNTRNRRIPRPDPNAPGAIVTWTIAAAITLPTIAASAKLAISRGWAGRFPAPPAARSRGRTHARFASIISEMTNAKTSDAR
jgi:hypothetical protein